MKLKLVRGKATAISVEGRLYVDDVFECFTVEDRPRDKKIYGVTGIPTGVYKVIVTMSNRFKKRLPEVLDVPGFKGIRIHAGNSSKDTEGCIIVGSVNTKDDDDWVGGSKIAMDRLLPKIEDALAVKEKVTLEIV
jgi:hypothetical protein